MTDGCTVIYFLIVLHKNEKVRNSAKGIPMIIYVQA